MSVLSLLSHSLDHVHVPRDDRDSEVDDYGQPVALTPVVTTVAGLVQPKSGREMDDSRDAGSAYSDHVIFLAPMSLAPGDYFTYLGDRYDVVVVRSYAFGTQPHLEVDVRRVVPETPAIVDA